MDVKTEVYYDQQFLSNPKKKVWVSVMEYPAESHDINELIAETKEQRVVAEKPLRLVKVTITTEIIEVFE
jgi:hypothetical protein